MSGMLAGLLLPVAVAAVASSVPGEAELKVTGWSLFGSFMVGLVSASSLLIGAALGVYVRAPKRVVAAIMAFGAGALIESLAIELAAGGAEKLIREEHLHPLVGWLWIATGFVVGGMVYAGANLALDNAGAAARKAASLRSYVRRARREKATDMLVQLSASDLFRSLPAADLVKLIPHAETRKLSPGAVIFRTGDLSDGVYLIEEGHVEFTPGGPGGMAGNYGPGHCFGEVELVTGEARMESATALDSVKLLFIPADDFGLVMLNSPALESAVRDLVAVHTHGAASVEHHIRQQARGVDTKTWVEAGVAAVAMPTHEEAAHHHGQEEEGGGSPLAIFMGVLLDGVPESVVLGAAYTTFSALNPTFLVAVFMANLPEAMSSSAQMVRAKYTPGRIFTLWLSLVLASALAAVVGNLFLASASEEVVVFVEAFAGGGIMAMLAQTMMPEAFEEGGAPVGLATIIGFLAAFVFTTIEMAH